MVINRSPTGALAELLGQTFTQIRIKGLCEGSERDMHGTKLKDNSFLVNQPR